MVLADRTHRLVVSALLGSSEVMHAGSVAESLLLRIGFAPPVVVLFMPSRKQVDSRTWMFTPTRYFGLGCPKFQPVSSAVSSKSPHNRCYNKIRIFG